MIQTNALMRFFLFKEFMSLFKRLSSQFYQHLFCSRWAWFVCYVRRNRTSIGICIGCDHITTHTFHALQLMLDLNCFKPFKIASKNKYIMQWFQIIIMNPTNSPWLV